jgi:hypothetical protein
MPSLSDIANDIKATLNNINTNTNQTAITAGQIKANTDAANIKLDTIEGTLVAGFDSVEHGLFALLESSKKANSLLEANSEENKTIICWVTVIADLLCRQLRKMNTQIELQTEMRDSLKVLQAISELANAEAALEAQRVAKLEAEIRRCCPPPEPQPEHCFDPCRLREVPTYPPKEQDWTPPKRQEPPK